MVSPSWVRPRGVAVPWAAAACVVETWVYVLFAAAAVSAAGQLVRPSARERTVLETLWAAVRFESGEYADPASARQAVISAFLVLSACAGLVALAGGVLGVRAIAMLLRPDYTPALRAEGIWRLQLIPALRSGLRWAMVASLGLAALRAAALLTMGDDGRLRAFGAWCYGWAPGWTATVLSPLVERMIGWGVADSGWLAAGIPPLPWLVAIGVLPFAAALARSPAVYRRAVASAIAPGERRCRCGYLRSAAERCPECGRSHHDAMLPPRWRWVR